MNNMNKSKKNHNNIKSKPKYLEYPYYYYIYKPNKQKCYMLAKKINNKIDKLPSGHKVIIDDWRKNNEINQLTDIFTEKCRVKCVFLDNPSPLEYWTKKIKYNPSNSIEYYRELIYKNTKLCNNFRISLVITILKMFNATRWLDISAGWGDRLLGAILSQQIEYYCGVDPNQCVQEGYKSILEFFFKDKPQEKDKYNLIQDGFETAKLPNNKTYDLVFSSPPFFDLETYSDEQSNSLISYNTEDKWLNGFLLPSIVKSCSVLDSKGHIVLYITESKNTKYISKMIEQTKILAPELKYKGKMYYKDSGKKGNLRDFHIWQKK